MVLKRKRSDSEISSSSSMLSSPLSARSFMSIDSVQSHQPQISTPSLFSSRTRKRHRDNRPSEADVHHHTLSILFSAQQQQQSPPQLHISPPSFPQQAPVACLPARQSSLHSFWTLPSNRLSFSSTDSSDPMVSPMTIPAGDSFFQPISCEDCDASLNPENDGEAMNLDVIDINIAEGSNHACTGCGKQVCHRCAVSNLGANRKCLMCAGKKKWVGGLGWMRMD
ncbi:hypothetical protein LSUB1_G003150 [Lachnellula subtilissima]|uniref:Uncharacterized protein n=1 Tax=Lachnellula subtilissima TaxID=602034 RepID=A0A8H8UHK2_9HELO|nr:hypothetical protein LSUB1_G003150 [Lachnellula subtilissima]